MILFYMLLFPVHSKMANYDLTIYSSYVKRFRLVYNILYINMVLQFHDTIA